MKQVENDQATKEMAEEFQRVYGTLNDDDLKKIYTI